MQQHNIDFENKSVDASIDKNLQFIKSYLGDGIGLSIGKFNVLGGKIEAGIIYIGILCDEELVNGQVISSLLQGSLRDTIKGKSIATLAKSLYIPSLNTNEVNQMKDIIFGLLKGNTIVFFEGYTDALIIQSQKHEKRSIDKPENEAAVFAAKDSFIEDIHTNISMIIRRLPIPEIRFETFSIGSLSHTETKIAWINGLANDEILDELRRRIKDVDIEMVDGTTILAELIQDKPSQVFPTYRLTERPDLVARALTDGYIAILCNNSPFAMIVPMMFWDSFKNMDDYSQMPIAATMLRITRIIAFFISSFISALYLSFVTYNHSIVPLSLALNISQGREGVPFPSIIELIVMTIIIDIIREAGTRMPGMVGYFIGTLGAVIIGQAAVSAGYVSVSLIIVVAFSAIASFAISSTVLVNTSRIINYFLILIAGFLGTVGLFYGIFIILWRMSILESFGVPYLYPVIPVEFAAWKDVLVRAPFKVLKTKLRLITNNKEEENSDE
ncbi:spore germination protein [Clostridium fungisolvens]|uniref:Spore germination protein B1 n=1 Tax=Clostridium fungisolvens TaxID=1604897 RepID=A0A6V8SNT3_9CLOT|nr:spore germination protein [Clostridium fungisolvens]GFP76523.1 Spore germination protein B1 [Clostridium fungisolvens]